MAEELSIPYRYEATAQAGALVARYSGLAEGESSGVKASVAGRVMLLRVQGKVAFAELRDETGSIQLFARANDLDSFDAFCSLSLGDWIGAKGEVAKTRRGELSVFVESFVLLAKARRGFGDKWHGINDVDTRHRQRYADLWANPEVRTALRTRFRIVSIMRRALESRGFIEVETPMLHPISGGALARPFVTHHNALDMDLFLRIAPELYLKRLVVGGFEKVFEIGRVFRNEGISPRHNPEFTMLELYEAFADYRGMMELTENMVSYALHESTGTFEVNYRGQQLDFRPPWKRISMVDAIKSIGEIDVDFGDREELVKVAGQLRLEDIREDMSAGELIAELFDQRVQGRIVQPTIVFDHPAEISPLAKKKRGDLRFAERFEPFVCGFEFGNAFSELNDPIQQKENFESQKKAREKGDEETHPYDADYITAMEYGLPPTGGLGIGIDRLCMVFANVESIKEVILFPQLRRLED